MKNVIVPIENMSLVRRVLLELKEKFIKSNKHTANLDVFCELEVRDKDGKLVSYRKFKSKSFVSNFLSYLRTLFIILPTMSGSPLPSGVSALALIGVNGDTINPQYLGVPSGSTGQFIDLITGSQNSYTTSGYFGAVFPMSVMAGANTDTFGIQIGTGTTTPTANDTALTSKLPNSSMTYGAMQVDSGLTNVTSNNVVFKFTRTFTNNTANTINVSEAGIVALIQAHDVTANTSQGQYVLLLHDVFSAQAVASGQVLTVRYTISITT